MTAPRLFSSLLASALLVPSLAGAQAKVARHWTGTALVVNNKDTVTVRVPVQLDLSVPATNGRITGTFINGSERSASSSGTLTGTHLVLHYNSFARTLDGTLEGKTFKGTFSGARIKPYTVELQADRDGKPATTFAAAKPIEKGGTINGDWEIAIKPGQGKTGETAWDLHVQPYEGNGEIRAVIQRIDGDSGSLYGRFDESAGLYRVSRFGDFGATSYTLQPNPDGTLTVANLRDPKEVTIARRPIEARKQNLTPPTKPSEQTGVVNPAEPLKFSGPNLAGETVSSSDDQFRGKVVIVAIGGSWCPNCHDEAPVLVDLYNRYHSRGLEVVDLSFEEDDQLKNPERLRAFITEYKIPYTVLLMGTPDELNAKLPQGKNLDSWPTSFFVGRDGLVKETHAGFSGPATGPEYGKLKADMSAEVEKLLAENQRASR